MRTAGPIGVRPRETPYRRRVELIRGSHSLIGSSRHPRAGKYLGAQFQRAESSSGRFCCKTILPIGARKIDSRPCANTQRWFKNSHGQIHSFQIYIPQLRHGDFCNKIPLKADIASAPRNVCFVPTAVFARRSKTAAEPEFWLMY